MATRKKSKSVLEKIGDAVTTGAEAVVEAGSNAVQAVGDLLPGAKPAPKKAKAKPTPKAAVKATPKAAVKATPKAAVKATPKAEVKTIKTSAPKKAATKPAPAEAKTASPKAAAKPAKKATPSKSKSKGTATKPS